MSSHRERGAGELGFAMRPPGGGGPGKPQVLVWESRETRLGIVLEVVSKCGAQASVLAATSESPGVRRDPALCLLALEDGTRFEECLALIRNLKEAGNAVLAYGDGMEGWAVAKRCRPLLAGAAKALDSSSAAFRREIEDWLRRTMGEFAGRAEADSEARALVGELGIIGESPAMTSIFRTLVRISRLSDVPVLLTGETGTGKELLARAIHKLDPRRSKGPMIAVNCGAIPEGLLESELFGHRKGAFTGGLWDRRGLVRSADGGVLFLDEIGELAERAQTKLLRVLQEGRVLGVGEETEVPVDVRVVAAANRNLSDMVREGAFRADLYHRISVVPIHVPPLRERPEDIAPLVRHFVRKHAGLASAPLAEVAPGFLEALRAAPLPGNVRQLENLVRWVLVHHEEAGPPDLADLPPEIWQQVSAGAPLRAPESSVAQARSDAAFFEDLLDRFDGSLSDSLDYCERRLIESALVRHNGNQTRAARLLGITPRSVYNKLHKHAARTAPRPASKTG